MIFLWTKYGLEKGEKGLKSKWKKSNFWEIYGDSYNHVWNGGHV